MFSSVAVQLVVVPILQVFANPTLGIEGEARPELYQTARHVYQMASLC